MAPILPQQQLLLELLIMSGDIAISTDAGTSILGRTLKECDDNGWTVNKAFAAGYNKVSITEKGRKTAAAHPAAK